MIYLFIFWILLFQCGFASEAAVQIVEEFLRGTSYTLTPLSGGLSGSAVYRLDSLGSTYVVRVIREDQPWDVRAAQTLSSKSAGKGNSAPRVLYIDPDLRGFIMEYVKGRPATISEFQQPNNLKQLAEAVKQFHHSKEPFPQGLSVLRSHRNAAGGKSLPNDLKEAMLELEGILAFFPTTPIHLDLHALNLMRTETGYTLIDWDNGDIGDPYIDLGMITLFLKLTPQQTEKFLKDYLGHAPSQTEKDHLTLARPHCLLTRGAYSYAPLSNEPIPSFDELLDKHEAGQLDFPQEIIANVLMAKGLELTESQEYKNAFNRIKKTIILEITK